MLVGLLGEISGPAHHAMMADILPEEKRQEGFGVLRVVGNLAWIIGPTIGGFIARRYFCSLHHRCHHQLHGRSALIVLPETKPAASPRRKPVNQESMWETLPATGCLRDFAFMAFLVAGC